MLSRPLLFDDDIGEKGFLYNLYGTKSYFVRLHLKRKTKNMKNIWIVTVRMDDGILTGPTDT